MKSKESLSQGFRFITDTETGRAYPIPEGGSGEPAPSISDGGGEGTVQDGGDGSGSQSSGQGFLEPYLADVPEDQRDVVAPVLEKFRKDQDANFNRRFEELREETNVATKIHQALLEDPVNTLNWIADRFQEEQGLDVRADLVERWNDYVQSGQEPNVNDNGEAQSGQGEEAQPLTKEEVQRILDERDQQAVQQQYEQQQMQQQQQQINNWIDEAAKSHGFSLDDSQGEDPLRPVIIMQANKLYEQGTAKGQAAIEMATEAVAKRFGSNTSNKNNGEGQRQPKVATGGTPPSNQQVDLSDSTQRKARMLEHLTSQ